MLIVVFPIMDVHVGEKCHIWFTSIFFDKSLVICVKFSAGHFKSFELLDSISRSSLIILFVFFKKI